MLASAKAVLRSVRSTLKGTLGIGVAGGPATTAAIQVNLHRLRRRHAVRQHNLAAEVERAPQVPEVRSRIPLLSPPSVGVVDTTLLTAGGWKGSRTSATATGCATRAAGRAATASAAVLLRPDSRSKQQTQNGSQNLDPLHDHSPFRVFRLHLPVRQSQQTPPARAFGCAVRRHQQQKGCGTGANTTRSRPDALAGRGTGAIDVWQLDRFEVINRAWISHRRRTVHTRLLSAWAISGSVPGDGGGRRLRGFLFTDHPQQFPIAELTLDL